MLKFKISWGGNKFFKIKCKNFGLSSIYSNYLIVGGGFAGKALTHLMATVKIIYSETLRNQTRQNNDDRCSSGLLDLSLYEIP